MGLGPISWLAIDRYCIAKRIRGDQREDLFELIRTLDNEYLKLSKPKDK